MTRLWFVRHTTHLLTFSGSSLNTSVQEASKFILYNIMALPTSLKKRIETRNKKIHSELGRCRDGKSTETRVLI